jgi:NADPH:quinone reductase-like Zn-dependent oxidoreductase
MRAYQLPQATGIDALVRVDLPAPKPGPRQVLIKVAACSLNFRDLAIALGTYRMPAKSNLVPLSDGAGEVVEIGTGVTRVRVGDRVAGCFFQRWIGGPPPADTHSSALGGTIDEMLREYAVLEEDGVVKLPAHLSFEEGASLPCAAVTAWHALAEHARIVAGQTVLAQGTGGVSTFALQFAQLMGAQVIVTSSSDQKLARAKQLGAAQGVNYKVNPEWGKAVLDLSDGGVDHVVEVGGPGTLDLCSTSKSARHICRLHANVRGHEPGYCGDQAQADHRQGVFVRQCTGGVPLFAVSAAFRESRNQCRLMMQQHIRRDDGNLRDQILRLEARC